MRCEAGGDRGFSKGSDLCSLPSPWNPPFLLRFRTGTRKPRAMSASMLAALRTESETMSLMQKIRTL